MGENITLNCSMRNRYVVAWYRLRSEELVLLISAEKDKNRRRLLTTYNQNRTRMKMTADSWVTRVSLTISGVTESDSGLYFYGIKSDTPEMHFDKPIRLEIEELPKEEDITELPKEEDITVGGSSDVRVRMGENITLNCSMRNRDEVAWYRLRSEELVLLISAEKDKTGRRLLTTYNQNLTRMIMTADSWVTRVSLTISGVTESDSGLYFYGIKSDTPEMHFNKPIRLEIEELPKEEDITELPKEEDITDGVMVTERVLMFAGVGLAVFVFLLTIVVGGVISYHRGQQRGWRAAKQEALMNQKQHLTLI
ncbi:unnamed protein product [Leuciscus chuanchicus]